MCLQSKVELLQGDKAFHESTRKYLEELIVTVKDFAAERRRAAAEALQAHAAEVGRRSELAAARASLDLVAAENEQRSARKTELRQHVADLKVASRAVR